MDVRDLEISLEATLAVTWPSTKDVRDALVDYFVVVARPFVLRGLAHSEPAADEATVRRILNARLGTLWRNLGSRWEEPSVDDLARFRERIEHYACVRRDDPTLQRARRLLDDLLLAAAVSERLRAVRQRTGQRRLRVIAGGGQRTAPRKLLKLVPPEQSAGGTGTPVPTGGG